MRDYVKYHGLGNDYLVMEPDWFATPLTPAMIRKICDRHRGVGSDGIMVGPSVGSGGTAPFVRIYNPDGSESAKSGNGLRIFARYLWDAGHATSRKFAIDTSSGPVEAAILDPSGSRIAVGMGPVIFESGAIPMTGPGREVLEESLKLEGRTLTVSAVSLGNPHCVVPVEHPTPAMARELGPQIESHASFPERTNVQFMAVLDAHRIRIEIWERGAGYTLASGSSSCAAAAVACRLGHCESPVTVQMQGGELEIRIDSSFAATLEGDVEIVGEGLFAAEFLNRIGLNRR